MTKVDYSRARYYLTRAIRELEVTIYKQPVEPLDSTSLSELEYYVSSLTLIRNSLYGCEDSYTGSLNLEECLLELQKDATAFYSMTKGRLTKEQRNCVHSCYVLIHKTRRTLKCQK